MFVLFDLSATGLWVFVPDLTAFKIILTSMAVFCPVCIVSFFWARRMFSGESGDIQNKVQDLFLIRQYYGTPDELTAAIKAMGAGEILFEDMSKSLFIPRALKLPFMPGTLGLIRGVKK